MKRLILTTILLLTSAVFLCNSAFADKGPRTTPNKVLNARSSGSDARWVFEGRLVTMARAADVKKDRHAAEMGDAEAQFRMAQRYDGGLGVQQNHLESLKWLRMSAEQDFPDAQYNLGSMYFDGRGVQEDPSKAAEWFRKAADQGHASAQKNLGAMYGRGQGVTQDHSEAYVWSVMAIMSGNESAANNRDVAATLLSPEQLDAANQRLAVLYDEFPQ